MRFKHEFIISPDAYYFMSGKDYQKMHEERLKQRGAEDIGRMIHEAFGFKQPDPLAMKFELDVHAFTDKSWQQFKEDVVNVIGQVNASEYLYAMFADLFRKLEQVGMEKSEEINKKRQG